MQTAWCDVNSCVVSTVAEVVLCAVELVYFKQLRHFTSPGSVVVCLTKYGGALHGKLWVCSSFLFWVVLLCLADCKTLFSSQYHPRASSYAWSSLQIL